MSKRDTMTIVSHSLGRILDMSLKVQPIFQVSKKHLNGFTYQG